MTIYIIDKDQLQRKLTVAQVNQELQQGTISTQAMAWRPGMEAWAPVLSLPDIQAPLPPPLSPDRIVSLNATNKLDVATMGESLSIAQNADHIFLKILSWAGLSWAYIFFVGICCPVILRRNGGESNIFALLCAALLGILLFRRTVRKRSELALIRNPSIEGWRHYFLSLVSAGWRWICLFIGIVFLASWLYGDFDKIVTTAERAIGLMIFIAVFSVDIPFRAFQKFHRESLSTFPKKRLAWGIFGGVITSLVFIPLFFALIIFTYNSAGKKTEEAPRASVENAATTGADKANQHVPNALIPEEQAQVDAALAEIKPAQSEFSLTPQELEVLKKVEAEAMQVYEQGEPIISDSQEFVNSVSSASPVADSSPPEVFDTKQIYREASPRIVKIEVLDDLGRTISKGSGVALGPSMSKTRGNVMFSQDAGTDVLTNYHVIENAKFVIVETKDEKTFAASIVFFNRDGDLAVLRIPASIVSTEVNTSNSPEVGDKVAAIGHPLGLSLTISEGIISAVPDKKYGILQTTAAISHGSSGGGLFDSSGNLIGIMTLGSVSNKAQNLNMAIGLNSDLVDAITEIREGGAIRASDIMNADHYVGLYQWDVDYLPSNFSSWEDTYRKNSKFADWIRLTNKINGVLNKNRTARRNILKNKKLSNVQKIAEYKALDARESGLSPLIQRRYESFPDDPSACSDYINLVKNNRHKRLLLDEWRNRWQTDMLLFLKAGYVYIEDRDVDEVIRMILRMRHIIAEPPETERVITHAWSRSQYNTFMSSADRIRRKKMDQFNEILVIFDSASVLRGLNLLQYAFRSPAATSQPTKK